METNNYLWWFLCNSTETLAASISGEQLIAELSSLRDNLVTSGNLNAVPVAQEIQNLYQQTRYTSTLYPDTVETISRLKHAGERPSNVAILTSGEPHFQLSKTIELMDTTPDLSCIFLTKVKKGDFFDSLLRRNPFRDMELGYTYDRTERGVGINFVDWQVMVTLFDDDPKQVVSFNSFAKEHDIVGLGVVRVRRPTAKRSHFNVVIPKGSAEVRTSDTLLDADLFEKTLLILEAKLLERFLIDQIKKTSPTYVLNQEETFGLIQAIADRLGLTYENARQRLLDKAGIVEKGLSIDE